VVGDGTRSYIELHPGRMMPMDVRPSVRCAATPASSLCPQSLLQASGAGACVGADEVRVAHAVPFPVHANWMRG
jgi:hypothetical protein